MGEEEKVERGSRCNHKLKIMYLMKILMEKTDETHDVTLSEIAEDLKAYGITAERKSLYRICQLPHFQIILELRNRPCTTL